jgi:hypothetical protein
VRTPASRSKQSWSAVQEQRLRRPLLCTALTWPNVLNQVLLGAYRARVPRPRPPAHSAWLTTSENWARRHGGIEPLSPEGPAGGCSPVGETAGARRRGDCHDDGPQESADSTMPGLARAVALHMRPGPGLAIPCMLNTG